MVSLRVRVLIALAWLLAAPALFAQGTVAPPPADGPANGSEALAPIQQAFPLP